MNRHVAKTIGVDAEAHPALQRGNSLWPLLGFCCLLTWSALAIACIDQPLYYTYTPALGLGYLAGIVISLFRPPRGTSRPFGSVAVGLGVGAAIANAIALVCPIGPIRGVMLALGSAANGMLVLPHARMLVTMPKANVVPTVAIGGLICSGVLIGAGLVPQFAGIGLAVFPLACAIFSRMSAIAEGAALDAADAHGRNLSDDAQATDTRHTAWPLPSAILLCAIISSIFTSLLSYPFLITGGNSCLYSGAFGTCLFACMAAWSILSRRRNVNGFVIVAAFMLELALLAFSAGIVTQVYIPIYAIVATEYVLSVLLWLLAANLSRSEHAPMPYRFVFALFVGCSSGCLGHVIGFTLDQYFDVPFSSMQMLGAVLLASFAVILIVFSSIEVIVIRSNLEALHARDVANVKNEAAREVESIKTLTAVQIANIWSVTAQQIEDAKNEANQQVARQVAQIQEQAADTVKMSLYESCQMLSDRFGLTARELEVMQLTCDGMSRAEIADLWFVSENTVKYHLRNVYRKLDVRNSREMLTYVEESRYVINR